MARVGLLTFLLGSHWLPEAETAGPKWGLAWVCLEGQLWRISISRVDQGLEETGPKSEALPNGRRKRFKFDLVQRREQHHFDFVPYATRTLGPQCQHVNMPYALMWAA